MTFVTVSRKLIERRWDEIWEIKDKDDSISKLIKHEKDVAS